MSVAIAATDAAVSPWRLRLRRFRRHRTGMAALGLLILLVLFCLSAWPVQALLGVDPTTTDLLGRFDPPGPVHLLGTDDAGRDVLVRLMTGGQVSLLVGLIATLVGAVVGVAIGVAAGYFGGVVDGALMRITDGVLALPLLPLLIVLGALDLTKLGFSPDFARSGAAGFWRVVVIISLFDWTAVARVVRAATLSLKEREFVTSARASGGGAWYVVLAHILPNVASPLIVALTLTVGTGDSVRIRAELPRIRHRPAHAELGQHAEQRPGPGNDGAVAGHPAGAADLPDGDRGEPAGRRPAPGIRPTGGISPADRPLLVDGPDNGG